MNNKTITLRVWGDFACFTRPEMKVERVSYSVMTPSAARGVLEAIFWEPEIYYLIDSIRVVRRGQWFSFRRNEVTEVINLHNVKQSLKSGMPVTPIFAGAGTPACAPRSMLALSGVEYLITAEIHRTELGKKSRHNWQTYYDEVTRRIQRGKCFHRPYLGVREFAADFDWERDPNAALQRRADEIAAEQGFEWRAYGDDLGLMLYDVFDYKQRTHERSVNAAAIFFHGKVHENYADSEGRMHKSFMDCHPQRVKILRKTIGGE